MVKRFSGILCPYGLYSLSFFFSQRTAGVLAHQNPPSSVSPPVRFTEAAPPSRAGDMVLGDQRVEVF